MNAATIDYLADNEDGVSWFSRTGVSRRRARRELANLVSEPLRTIKARPVFLRPAELGDCGAASHELDAAGEPPDECSCRQYMGDEPWWFECASDHTAAVPAWRCEASYRSTRLSRWRGAAWRRYAGHRYRRPASLWGGRVQRKANRLERLVFGRWYAFTVPGDRQLCLREREWRWCDTCDATTPHTLRCVLYPNNRELCVAEDHHARHVKRWGEGLRSGRLEAGR